MASTAFSELPADNFTAPRRHNAGSQRLSDQMQADAVIFPLRAVMQDKPSENQPRRQASIFPKIFGVAVMAALWIGWVTRDDNGLTPVNGPGYWLGIVGGSMMLILALYPMRKRMRSPSVLGSVTFWFNAHMVLGILGPMVVLWHANFKLGSVNSAVALIITLVVAGSGVIGRYLHAKINSGLYARKAEAQEVMADADELRGFIGADPHIAERMVAQLNAFAKFGTAAPNGLFAALVLLPLVVWRGAVIRMRLLSYARRVIAVEGERRVRSQKVQRQQIAGVTEFVTRHIGAAKGAATFALYERLFRFWHVFHVPLYILLVIVAFIHIYASHFF